MSDDDEVISAAERITRIAGGTVNIEEYQTLLFPIAGMLSVWRTVMDNAGYSTNFIEKSAWLLLTSFYGHHLTEIKIDIESNNNSAVRQGRPSPDQG